MRLKKIVVSVVFLGVSFGLFAESQKNSVQEYYSQFLKAFEEKKWKDVVQNSQAVLREFPKTSFAEEARYYQGVAYFHLGDFDWANRLLSEYLKQSVAPKFFEEALSYKFLIAEKYRMGTKKHLFGSKKLPSWATAKDEALKIYDEISHALPAHELAAKSLFSKGALLATREEYQPSNETLESLIRNFPKSPQALEAFLLVGKNYLSEINPKQQDMDLLAKAEINIRRFKEAFPQEERILEANKMLGEMKEVYAQSLYEVAQFFERTKKKQAAIIYYTRIAAQFPETQSAQLSQKRMQALKK